MKDVNSLGKAMKNCKEERVNWREGLNSWKNKLLQEKKKLRDFIVYMKAVRIWRDLT
jgi:hypothetical protein